MNGVGALQAGVADLRMHWLLLLCAMGSDLKAWPEQKPSLARRNFYTPLRFSGLSHPLIDIQDISMR
jgi:hypothetical protein